MDRRIRERATRQRRGAPRSRFVGRLGMRTHCDASQGVGRDDQSPVAWRIHFLVPRPPRCRPGAPSDVRRRESGVERLSRRNGQMVGAQDCHTFRSEVPPTGPHRAHGSEDPHRRSEVRRRIVRSWLRFPHSPQQSTRIRRDSKATPLATPIHRDVDLRSVRELRIRHHRRHRRHHQPLILGPIAEHNGIRERATTEDDYPRGGEARGSVRTVRSHQ